MIIRTILFLLVLATAGIAGFVAAARFGLLTPDDATLRERYALPGSRFLDIDGQSIHYMDEGSGESLLLIHGSYGSLRNWDDWSRVLSKNYRVIRFDLPRLGLSDASPGGRFGAEDDIRIIQALRSALQFDRFYLAGTSSGGEPAAAYAAEFPEQVKGLILSNIAIGPFGMDSSHWSPLFRFLVRIDPWFKGWHPDLFWREVMRNNFFDPAKLTPALVEEWTDLNNRAQGMPPRVADPAAGPPFARTPADLARIQAPTLLLWSANDAELPVETIGTAALELLGAADKTLEVVADCGHMMPLECGAQSAEVAQTFLLRQSAISTP